MHVRTVSASLLVALLLAVAACEGGETVSTQESGRIAASGPTVAPAVTETTTPAPAAFASPPRGVVPVTATPVPGPQTPIPPIRAFSLPSATDEERTAASTGNLLYLSGFNFYTVNALDPVSGHGVHEIPVRAQNPGIAVSPDGARLYVLDMWWDRGAQWAEGEVYVYDTNTWTVVHRQLVNRPALLLGGNPISLSGDGRWLFVARLDYSTREGTTIVFDTERMEFLPDTVLPGTHACTEPWLPPRLTGRPGQPRLYAPCKGAVVAFDADTLSRLWEADAPTSRSSSQLDLVVSTDGTHLYGLYPQVVEKCCRGTSVYVEGTELILKVWAAASGDPVRTLRLSEFADVPTATIGRGNGAYLAMSPDGTHLYVLWEDKLWELELEALRTPDATSIRIREVALPAPADEMAISVEGDELYLLASTAGDLARRGRGMWTVSTDRFEVVRQTLDWPDFPAWPLFYAAPARPARESDPGR